MNVSSQKSNFRLRLPGIEVIPCDTRRGGGYGPLFQLRPRAIGPAEGAAFPKHENSGRLVNLP